MQVTITTDELPRRDSRKVFLFVQLLKGEGMSLELKKTVAVYALS